MAGKQYSPDVIPEVGVQLPSGRFMFKIEEMDDSERTSNGKYQIRTTLRVVEPAQFQGTPHYENFVIGSDSDPEADDPDTWKSYAAGRYKQLLKKAGVEPSGDIEGDAASATDQLVGGLVVQSIEPPIDRHGQPNAYAGRIRSQTQAFFRPGERETGVDATTDGASASAPARPAAPRGAPTPQVPKKLSVAPPPQQAKPPAKPAPAAAPPKAKTLPCPICQQPVVREQLGAHVEQHNAGEEE